MDLLKNLNKFIYTLLFIFTFSLSAYSSPTKIYILQIVDHPALNTNREGFIDELERLGYKQGENLILEYQSAQGNTTTAAQIAQKFVAGHPDIIMTLGTTASQTAMAAAKDTKTVVLFSSVTDPLSAKLVADFKKPEGNVTGVSNFISVEPQFQLFKKLRPNLKTLGVIYNPGEPNSVALNEEMEKVGKSMGIKILLAPAPKTNDVLGASQSLCGKVDAFFVNNDNTALSAFNSVVKTARECKIPVFVSDVEIVDQGALAALGPDQKELGKQTARMAVKILKDPKASLPAVEFPEKTEERINK
jgi:putative ABC transport system substrate-binding protein